MNMLLCRPCAETLKAKKKLIRHSLGKDAKITCESCGRRRYGAKYEVRSER